MTMPPKRKFQVDPEEADAPAKSAKMSKKDKLAEARARAREWAESEATKKKKPSTATSSSTAKENPTKARTPSRSTVVPTKSSVPKSSAPKAAVKSAAYPPRVVQTKSPAKKPASSNKITVERRKAEARARAKAWALEEEAKKLASPKVAAAVPKRHGRPSPVKQDSGVDDEDELMNGDEEVEGEEEIVEESDDEEVEKNDMEENALEEREVHDKPAARSPAPTRPPFSSPGRPIATKKRTPNHTAVPLPPQSRSTYSRTTEPLPPVVLSGHKQVQAEQDRETQEKIELERQIQHQVMTNAVNSFHETGASKAPSVTQQDVVKFMQHQQLQPPQYPYTQPEYETRRKRPFLFYLSILVGAGAVVWAFMSGSLARSVDTIQAPFVSSFESVSPTLPGNVLPVCFVDTFAAPEEEEAPSSPFTCDEKLTRTPCPLGGQCASGHLQSCEGPYSVMSPNGSQCVLSEASNATLADIESLLTNWTTQCYCDFNGVDFALKSESNAGFVFPLKQVMEQVKVDEALISLSIDYAISTTEDAEVLVGLSDDYVDNKMVLPAMCWASLVLIETVRSALSTVARALLHTTSAIFSVTFAYPLASFICLAVLLIIHYTRSLKQARKQLSMDVASIREVAYQRMMSDSLEHVVLHLRDGIAMDLHPTNKKGRSYLILKVWPRVVADVRFDNRVKKTNRLVGGKPRDVWQWVANPASASKYGVGC